MPDNVDKKLDRRSFLKWSALSWPALALGIAGGASQLLAKDRSEMVFDLKSGPEVATDCSLGGHCRLVADQDFILRDPHNASDGDRMVWEIIQDSIGSRKIRFDNKFAFGDDMPHVVLSTGAHKRDFITAIYNAPLDKWHVVACIKGY